MPPQPQVGGDHFAGPQLVQRGATRTLQPQPPVGQAAHQRHPRTLVLIATRPQCCCRPYGRSVIPTHTLSITTSLTAGTTTPKTLRARLIRQNAVAAQTTGSCVLTEASIAISTPPATPARWRESVAAEALVTPPKCRMQPAALRGAVAALPLLTAAAGVEGQGQERSTINGWPLTSKSWIPTFDAGWSYTQAEAVAGGSATTA